MVVFPGHESRAYALTHTCWWLPMSSNLTIGAAVTQYPSGDVTTLLGVGSPGLGASYGDTTELGIKPKDVHLYANRASSAKAKSLPLTFSFDR